MGIRVKLSSLYHPDPPHQNVENPDFSEFENQVRWVGPPFEYQEGATPEPTFVAAQLQCDPYFTNEWGTIDLLHVFGDAIIPSSSYDVRMIHEACYSPVEETNYSLPLTITTARWGDVTEPFNPTSTSTQPNIADVLKLVDKWLGNLEPRKSLSQLQPQEIDPNISVSIADVLKGVDAWLGTLYPFTITTCTP